MEQILFLREEFFPLIDEGTKTSTLRKGKRDISCGPLIFKRADCPNIHINVMVTEVNYIPYEKLSTVEANLEGYMTIGALRNVLSDIYGPIGDNEIFTQITFYRVQE